MKLLKDYSVLELLRTLWVLLTRYLPVYVYVYVIRRICLQLWLITERPTDARDNGYVLFEWLRENHPELRVVYAIRKDSVDYDKVNSLGKVIEFGSYSHWYYYFAASICCDAGWRICAPDPMAVAIMRNILPHRAKRVFLQHGIIKDYMPQGLQPKLKADLFVCGAYPEWEYISKNFGYKHGEVRYIGLARYDRLVDTSEKHRQILFMPTWRANLAHVRDLTATTYYQQISSFLNSTDLCNFLENTDSELIYFLHPAIRQHKHYFESLATDRIRVLNNEDADMQLFICSARMLVTDFSSIYFDFAYQGKPVVYYHFDYEEYRQGHYTEGYFDYDRDGFGPVVHDKPSLISTLKTIVQDGWTLPEPYPHRADRFFPIRDRKNCQRHYDALCELEPNRDSVS